MLKKTLRILGTRGIPAQHGGFETFGEKLALHLAGRGWAVTVYCQDRGEGPVVEEAWNGVRLVRVPVRNEGPLGTIVFDWKSTLHAAREPGLVLTLGYNTAVFCLAYRLKGIRNLINMDGIEWRRKKWGLVSRAWFYVNERLGCWLGNHLIADNPGIADHLASRTRRDRISMIPYGAELLENADPSVLDAHGLQPGGYALVVARAEPENSLLEVVTAFSAVRRGVRLVVLGRYEPERNAYHAKVMQAGSNEVMFLGPVYERRKIAALRFFAWLYIHGHTVGGTNPALVEAMGAGLPVLAHGNRFNRWVAGSGARYFLSEGECGVELDTLIDDPGQLATMRDASRRQFLANFTWPQVLTAYELLLERWQS